MQYFGIFHTYKVFNIIGSFDNPAGFAACLAVGFPFCFSALDGNKQKRHLAIIALVIITLSIILSGSRASIIAILVVSSIFLVSRYHPCFNHYRKYLLGVCIVILVTGAILFFLKKDSAIGRILIWINSLEMILDYPILGSNSGSFLRNYMLYQADYFKLNPNSQYIMLADNVKHPFNEYLLLTIKYGIGGLLALIAVIFSVIKSLNKINNYHLCLLSIGIVAFSLIHYVILLL
ncbi:MAG: O-antigen ligase family protein [Clostridium paraputrificum]